MKTLIPSFIWNRNRFWLISFPLPTAFFLFFQLSGFSVLGKPDPVLRAVESLKSNVVIITANFQGNKEMDGFGFVTGLGNGKMYIVTAGRVVNWVKDKGGDIEKANKINVQFISNYVEYEAKEVKYFAEYDLSLLEIDMVSADFWERRWISDTDVKLYDKVRYVGSDKKILSSVEGNINDISRDHIFIPYSSVADGTSGAPLIGSTGILGMYIQFDGTTAKVLKVHRIMELIDPTLHCIGSRSYRANILPDKAFLDKVFSDKTLGYLGLSGTSVLGGGLVLKGIGKWNTATIWYRDTYAQYPSGVSDREFEAYQSDYTRNSKLLIGLGTAVFVGGTVIFLKKIIKGGSSESISIRGDFPSPHSRRIVIVEPVLGNTWEGLPGIGITVRFNRD